MKLKRYDYAAYSMFFTYAAASVIIPMALCHIAVTLDFPLTSGGLTAGGALQIGRAIPMVLSMIFCGFMAAKYGMRRSIQTGIFLLAAGMLTASVSPHYLILFASLSIAGLGEGIIEGIGTPFVQELHTDNQNQYVSLSHSFWSVGVLCITLVTGYLLGIGVLWRYLVAGIVILAMFSVLLLRESKTDPYPERKTDYSPEDIRRQSAAILSCPRFWIFYAVMIFSGGGEYGLTFWTASYVQLTFGGSPLFAGLCTACFAFGMFIGRSVFGVLITQKYLYHLVMWAALGGVIVSLLLPVLNSDWLNDAIQSVPSLAIINSKGIFCLLLFAAGLASAPFWPSVQSYTVLRLPHLDSTMQFIILSCAGVPGCALFTWLMGYLGNHYGMRIALLAVPFCYFFLGALLFFERRKFRDTPA